MTEIRPDEPVTRATRAFIRRTGRHVGGRLAVLVGIGCALAVGLSLWWRDTPAGSITDTAGVLVAAGQITGLVGGFVLLLQVLLMSRAGWLERWVGGPGLLGWHRELGGVLLVVVLAHMAFTIVGYSASSGLSIWSQTWLMLTEFPAMLSAFIATGILVVVGVLAIRTIRMVMPYELWYYLHLGSYLVLLLSYGHQFANGQELAEGSVGRWYWLSLYVFVLGALAWGRFINPLRINLRHRLRVIGVVPEGTDMVSIYIGGRWIDEIESRAGQYFRWRFVAPGCWWQTHPFSLSAAPNSQWLRLTVKTVGGHTERLRDLPVGVRVLAEGPSGVFTADRRLWNRALLIAGGSGIAPIRALLEELPRDTIVIYRARNHADLVFRDELNWLARERGARVWYVLGSRDDPAPQHLFTPDGLRELVPDVSHRDIYLCGPPGLVDVSLAVLRRLRVRRRQIHVDPFEF